jgi:hypothetical protein
MLSNRLPFLLFHRSRQSVVPRFPDIGTLQLPRKFRLSRCPLLAFPNAVTVSGGLPKRIRQGHRQGDHHGKLK